MGLRDAMAQEWEAVANVTEHAQEITYTPATGAASSVVAVFDPLTGNVEDGVHVTDMRTAHLYLPPTSAPVLGDTFTINGEVWDFQSIRENSALSVVVLIHKSTGIRAGGY